MTLKSVENPDDQNSESSLKVASPTPAPTPARELKMVRKATRQFLRSVLRNDLDKAKLLEERISDIPRGDQFIGFRMACEERDRIAGKTTADEYTENMRNFAEEDVFSFVVHLACIGQIDAAIKVVADELDNKNPSSYKANRLTLMLAQLKILQIPYLDKPFLEPDRAEPVLNCAIQMIMRDEEDIILHNLEHHYRLGFRKFIMMVHCSQDETVSLLRNFRADHPDAIVLMIDDIFPAFFQPGRLNAVYEFARHYFSGLNMPCDWIFPLDADEFIDFQDKSVNLKSLIKSLATSKVFYYEWCNGTSRNAANFDRHGNIYDHFNVIVRNASFGFNKYFTKCAARVMEGVTISKGSHTIDYNLPRSDEVAIASSFGVRLVHLPIRSVAQMVSKFENGSKATMLSGQDTGAGFRGNQRKIEVEGPNTIFRSYHRATLKRRGALSPEIIADDDE